MADAVMTGREAVPAALVAECDVTQGLKGISAPRAGIPVLLLVRAFTEPIGELATVAPDGELGAELLGLEIVAALEPKLRERFEECGLPWEGTLPREPVAPLRTPRYLRTRAEIKQHGPSITAVICTHNRADTLEKALLAACHQDYERLKILVIDNAPSDDRTRELVAGFSDAHDVAYAVEPRAGLSRARNRAIEVAGSEIIAWLDDDDHCDPWWASEIARGFVEVPDADAVTGTVFPDELETASQLMFEQYASVRRHRGFERAVFTAGRRGAQSPLYPMPPFGIGANMAFRSSALERIGGFDPELGAGTPARSGEDTAALTAVLLTGGAIVYQPTAVVFHGHRREYQVLRDLLKGHGRGLGGYYASTVSHYPRAALEIARLVPRAFKDQLLKGGRVSERAGEGFPPELLRANRVGILQGPFIYAKARFRASRAKNGR